MTVRTNTSDVQLDLGELTGEELFVLSVFAPRAQRERIGAELEKRAVNSEIRNLLRLNSLVDRTADAELLTA